MKAPLVNLPYKIEVGGNDIEIQYPIKCNNNHLGQSSMGGGFIRIAETFNHIEGDRVQSDSSKTNTFYHELMHIILSVMGRDDLNNDEQFVCTFSSFLTGAMRQIVEFQFPNIKRDE